jgi:hypothetical protein
MEAAAARELKRYGIGLVKDVSRQPGCGGGSGPLQAEAGLRLCGAGGHPQCMVAGQHCLSDAEHGIRDFANEDRADSDVAALVGRAGGSSDGMDFG